MAIYEVLDFCDPAELPRVVEMIEAFSHGVRMYRQADWQGAIKVFEQSARMRSGDRLSQMYVERCQCLLKDQPRSDWDCVWVMADK